MKFSHQLFTRISKTITSMRYSILVACLFSVGINNSVTAAPGLIENSPLFLTSRAEPNIFFMLDDSNSMDTELMSPEYVPTWGGLMTVSQSGNRDYRFVFGTGGVNSRAHSSYHANNNRMIPHFDGLFDDPDHTTTTTPTSSVFGTPTDSLRGVWRARSYQYNAMYYNPHIDYSHWAGANNEGTPTPYSDITDGTSFPANVYAPYDPFIYTGGATDAMDLVADQTVTARLPNGGNLSQTYYPAFYNVWFDTDSDGVVDPTDEFRKIEIRSTTTQCSGTMDNLDQYTNNCILRTPEMEIQNFANWFSYYRKRESVAKYGVSQVIDQALNVRMGIATIHNDNSNERAILRSMENDATTGDKRTLLNALYEMETTSQTPLFPAVRMTGEYYECAGGTGPFGTANASGECGIQVATPIEDSPGICQQNYMIMVTDGDYSTTQSTADNDSDDTTTSTTYYPTGTAQAVNLKFDGAPYADNIDDTLADLTMYYYERDLNTSLENRVPMICGVDENPMQHMVSYILGYGVEGSLDPDTDLPPHPRLGYANSCTATTETAPAWPASTSGFSNIIDDVVHAAYNGRGDYLSAQDPQTLTTSLETTLRNIASRTGAASAVSLNSSTLSTGSVAYFARFNSSNWQGEFSAYPITNNSIDFANPNWEAHRLLETKSSATVPGGTNRAIVTFDRASASYGAVAFRAPLSSLPTRHQDDLKTSPTDTVDSDAVGEARLNYIRGDHSCESSSALTCATSKDFRDRIFLENPVPTIPNRFVLGDIIHSSSVFVGAPKALLPGGDPFGEDGKRYRDFKNGEASASTHFSSGETAKTRTDMLYVGSNDGMLHAFNADTGDEVWAYIPGALFQKEDGTYDFGPGLHTLTEKSYEHRYYVDLTPKVADAYIDIDGTGAIQPDWRTVLVGGLRAGGRGYFAIDITDPDELINDSNAVTRETKLANRVLWEFTTDDDRDLGLTYSEPQIIPLGSGSSVEWYVVFGNGYNSLNGNINYASAPVDEPGDPSYIQGSNTHSSKLFILKLEGPIGGSDATRWEEGQDYWKIDTEYPAGASLSETVRNGMSTAAIADSVGDSIGDTTYAGDLEGNMWAFDIAGTNQSQWDVYKSGSTAVPFFIATDAAGVTGNRQPITAKPTLLRNSNVPTVDSGAGKNTPNLLVSFGTGQYLTQADLILPATPEPQSFYTVWDSGASQAPLDNSDLTNQGITTDTGPLGDTFRVISPATLPVNYVIGGNSGWYHNLPTAGERVINEAVTDGTATAYITIIPSDIPCSFGGTSWLMLVDAITGTALSFSPYDVDNNGYIDGSDVTTGGDIVAGTATSSLAFNATSVGAPNGAGVPGNITCPPGTIKKVRFVTLSDGNVTSEEYCGVGKRGRASWREINFTQ